MLVSNKSSFKGLMVAVGLLLNIASLCAQNNTVSIHTGPNGIWVLCGKQLPKDFTYRILRQKNNEGWVKQTDLNFPDNKEELQGKMLAAQQLANLNIGPLSDVRLKLVWERLVDPIMIDLPVEMEKNYPLRQANGTAWYDAAVDSAVSYAYKVQLIEQEDEVISESISKAVSLPSAKPFPALEPLSIRSIDGSIVGEYHIIETGGMSACKIFRSRYLRTDFEEVWAEPIFLTRDSISILQFTDKTAVKKVPYTYVVQPIDAAGNVGNFSSQLSAFNVVENTIVPSVVNFKTRSVEEEKAIKLSWKLKDSKDVIAIDIYKSATYDGNYFKIASVSPTDTTYLDYYANPIETYYYTIRLNGTYEKSPPSPRVAGILKASNANYFPPSGLRLKQDKNIVSLIWERTEPDTRAYYVYRSTAKTQKMEQISPIIITDSAIISYTDTLPENMERGMYSYAVADQNTSYAISAISAPVFAHVKGAYALPIPHDLDVLRAASGKLRVIWPDMRTESPFLQGYMLYRRASSIDGTIVEPLQAVSTELLPPAVNNYIDSTAKEGMIYYYSLRTIGDSLSEMSSPSLEAGITLQLAVVNGAENVRAFVSGKSIAIKWNNPVGDELKSVKIIRSTEGKDVPEEIASLDATTESFTDTKVAVGGTYYYQVQIENKEGKRSRMTDAVGLKIYN